MATGSRTVNKTPEQVVDRLRMLLAAANCEILEQEPDYIRFRHGTVLTQTAPMLPKEGVVRIVAEGDSTRIDYQIQAVGFPAVWLTIMGVVLSCLIFPAILAHRSLVYHPRRFMENLLAGL